MWMYTLVGTGGNFKLMYISEKDLGNEIKAVIFDCFGVLAFDCWSPFKNKYFGSDPEVYNEATEYNRLSDAGKISFGKFVEKMSELANLSYEQALQELTYTPANDDLFDYIQKNIFGKYNLGILSNVSENMIDRLFSKEQVAMFDSIVLSCEIGHVKPEVESYDAISRSLKISPGQAVFVDDQPRYVIGAQDFGMKAVHYKSLGQATSEINMILDKEKEGRTDGAF